MTAIKKLTDWFFAQVGYCEKATGNLNYLYSKTINSGSANYTCYGYEMHRIQPSTMDYPAAWCDAFVDNGFVNVFGEETARKLLHDFDDYTVRSAELYKQHGEWHTSCPREGDQIFFKNANGGICHTGYVYAVDQTYVYTVEGNTSGAAGVVANGGCVAKKKYTIGYTRIAGYGRPKYSILESEDEPMTKEERTKFNELVNAVSDLAKKVDDLTKPEMIWNYIDSNIPAWALEAVRWANVSGIIKGDENGKLQLNSVKLWTLVVLYRAAKWVCKQVNAKI